MILSKYLIEDISLSKTELFKEIIFWKRRKIQCNLKFNQKSLMSLFR